MLKKEGKQIGREVNGNSEFNDGFISRIKNLSITSWLVIANIIIYFVVLYLSKYGISYDYFALKPSRILQGQYLWTLVSYMLIHASFFHIFISILLLVTFGWFTERVVGRKVFALFYLISGILIGLVWMAIIWIINLTRYSDWIVKLNPTILGASAVAFAIAGLFVMILPKLRFTVVFLPILSFPAYVLVPFILIVIWAVLIFMNLPIGNLAHVIGFLIGIVYGYFLKKKYKSKIQMLHGSFSDMEKEDVARFPSEDPSPILRVAKDGVILYANDASKLLLKTWKSKVGKNVSKKWRKLIQETLSTNTVKNTEIKLGNRIFSISVVPVVSDDYANLYGLDITALKQTQAKLRVRNIELVSLASHEMNTPLTSITGLVEAVLSGKMGKITDKQKESLDIVFNDAHRLHRVIKNMVDASRIDEGVAVYKFKPFEVSVLIERAIETGQVMLKEKNMQAKFEGGKAMINGDEARIEQVILNLITNAIKYGKVDGHIWISLKKDKEDVVLAFKDDGQGIAKNNLESVFSKDFKVQKRSKRVIGGLGYGLYISKKIIEAHKGKIWVESELGKGSTFYIKFGGGIKSRRDVKKVKKVKKEVKQKI